MSESLNRRAVVAGTVTAGIAALGALAAAEEPKAARVKLIEIKESDLQFQFNKRFKKQPNLTTYMDMALAINTWLGDNRLGMYSGFWTGEMGKAQEDSTYQICIIHREA